MKMVTKSKSIGTMAEHLQSCGALEDLIEASNTMAVKLAAELEKARDALEKLEPERYEQPTAKPTEDRSAYTTSTHTDNPFNSTPFTVCCGVAAINEDRCPVCKAEITGHDDGLSALRKEVGHGNCLMCGEKRGPIGIQGNCHC